MGACVREVQVGVGVHVGRSVRVGRRVVVEVGASVVVGGAVVVAVGVVVCVGVVVRVGVVVDVEELDEVREGVVEELSEVSLRLISTRRSSTGGGSDGEAATRKPKKTSNGTQIITARRSPSRLARRLTAGPLSHTGCWSCPQPRKGS